MIETSELKKSFRTGRGPRRHIVHAVAGIDLRVKESEIFGFLGPNGAGKSTTLHMLATLVAPDSGTASIAGVDLLRQPGLVRRRIGLVAQQSGTTDEMTPREELILYGRLHRLGRAEAGRRADRLIEDFELGEFAGRRCRTLSGGQRRRVDLALGVVHEPTVLLLDEPTAGLDPSSRTLLWREIRRLRAAGTSVVLTTHYLEEADALCDRVSIVDHGRIVAEGTPEELKRQVSGDVVTLRLAGAAAAAARLIEGQSCLRELEVTSDTALRLVVDRGTTAIPVLMRLLDAAEVEIRELAVHQPSLDDVFLCRTGRSLGAPEEGEVPA
ncbi:ATP-binding cassette domain-containing protein [Micromonospora sp. LOL_024]|uniref:ATP-binding cassette domain-containing protein n=1 Tax=Micromonospora sp. LOL_024 TaxID=3345412 RepID=UPI003A845656